MSHCPYFADGQYCQRCRPLSALLHRVSSLCVCDETVSLDAVAVRGKKKIFVHFHQMRMIIWSVIHLAAAKRAHPAPKAYVLYWYSTSVVRMSIIFLSSYYGPAPKTFLSQVQKLEGAIYLYLWCAILTRLTSLSLWKVKV